MTIGLATGSIVAKPGQAISLSSLFSVTPGAGNPQYLIVSGLDRDEYTASSTNSTGTFSGNGHTDAFASIGGDGLGAGIVFTYDASTGQYVNTTYGNLGNVVLTASHDQNRNESISLFATNNSAQLTQYADNPYALEQLATYVGSVSVVTQPTGPAPTQATPSSIASTAMSFVGQSWNMDGCWVLCSNIAAEAGASLPITSTSVGIAGKTNGEWIVAYNGPAGDTANWQSLVKAGEMVSFATSSTSGHITTVVSGSGASAMLVDNITYVYNNGSIANAANDGSSNDIVIAAPHAASQEFAQAVAGSVVIYELDTPTVRAVAAGTASVAVGGTLALSSLFTATDPANHAIAQYQVYDTGTQGAAADTFLVNGAAEAAHSAATAITVSTANLAATALQAANTAGVDTLQVRAFNGTYWGDWQALGVDVAPATSAPVPAPAPVPVPSPAPAPAPSPVAAPVPAPTPWSPPVLSSQTENQVWFSRHAVNFTLAANTFADPQGSGMSYSAYQIGGATANWLRFNGASDTFSGAARRNTQGTISLAVIATDAQGLSAVESFNVTMAPTAHKFAQAISQLHSGRGAGVAAPAPPPVATLHALYTPIA